MDVQKVAKLINLKIHELEQLKPSLETVSHEKALSEGEYDKVMAKTIIGLKNGFSYQIDGILISSPPVTIIEKIARGICWQEKIKMDSADTKYRNTLKIIDITESQLNGYQSINRYLAENL